MAAAAETHRRHDSIVTVDHTAKLSHDNPHVAYGQFPVHTWQNVKVMHTRTHIRGSFGGWDGYYVKLHKCQGAWISIPFADFGSIDQDYIQNIIKETQKGTAPKDIAPSESIQANAAAHKDVALFAQDLRSKMMGAQHETMKVHESEIDAARAYSYEFWD